MNRRKTAERGSDVRHRGLSNRHLPLAALCALLLAAAAAGGPDYSRYEDWGLAAQSGSLWEARVYTISPQGVPLMMWAHGTGFIFAVADLMTPAWLDFRASAMLAGWLASLILWAAMLRTLWLVAQGDAVLTLFGAALFFVATHGGYFSHVHASESLALAATAVLVWLAFEPRPADGLAFLAAGLSLAFLVVIKPYWVLYGTGTLAVLGLRTLESGVSRAATTGRLSLVALPVAAAAVQTAYTNRWMTGSWLRSSYQFGDAGFRSFDFANPELAAVLLHPWHGLIPYHPFYAVGALALMMIVVQGAGPNRRQGDFKVATTRMRVFFACGALAIAVNLYVQAAWVVWWLGRGTFGMRGMAPAAALVVPAFIIVAVRFVERRPAWLGTWIVIGFACALWSTMLLWTGIGPQFLNYSQLLSGVLATLDSLRDATLVLPLISCAVGLGVLLSDVWRPARGVRRATAMMTLVLLSFALVYLVGAGSQVLRGRSSSTTTAAVMLVAFGTVAATLWGRWIPLRPPSPLVVLALGQATTFLIASLFFLRLAARIESDIAVGRRPPHDYAYVNTFSTRDMIGSCNEYRHLPEFRDKREAFKAFLIRRGVDPASFRF